MTAARSDRGFALIIVLWSLVLVSLLLIHLSLGARSDVQLTANLRRATELQAAADGAISTEVFALLQGAAGPARGDDGVMIETASQSGLLNPNTASPELLAALMARVGADPRRAAQVASAIADWRAPGQAARPGGAKAAQYRAAGLTYGPPGAPFEHLDELRLVLGMTPPLFAAVAPHLTLYWDGAPDPGQADPVVQAALRDVGVVRRPGPAPYDVVRITATARRDGAQIVRQAVVRVGMSSNRRLWRVLEWD